MRFSKLKILSIETRAAMDEVAERVSVAAGETILTEGEHSNDLYIIESGSVTGVRKLPDEKEEVPVVNLGPGDILGEDSFLDSGPQNITARAATDCVLLKVSPFEILALENGDHYYDNLRASVGITVVRRLREGTDAHVVTLGHQLEGARTQQHFGQFFLYTLVLFSLGMVINNVISSNLLKVDIHTQLFAWQYLAVLLVPSLIVVWIMRIPLSQMGWTTHNLKKSLIDGGIVSAVFILLTVGFVVVSNTVDALPDRKVSVDPSGLLPYLIHSFLQELVARGFMQGSIQRFLNDERGFKSVAVGSFLFGVFHIHFGLAAVVVTYLSCVFFGIFYNRHHNLAGVTLIHYVLGICAFSSGIL
jgi:membrane protease YdiL (CAAX protease family)